MTFESACLMTQAVDFSLVTFQPSRRSRRKTNSSGTFGFSWEISPASTQLDFFLERRRYQKIDGCGQRQRAGDHSPHCIDK